MPSGSSLRSAAVVFTLGLAVTSFVACDRNRSSANGQANYPPYGAPAQGYPPGYAPGYNPNYPPQGYGNPPPGYGNPPYQGPAQPPSNAPLPTVPTTPSAPPVPTVSGDPINSVDMGWLRSQAGSVIGALMDALPPVSKAKVENIPFVADPTVGMVNAFAACDEQGQPLMAISDGLLEVEAYISQLRATDELFHTAKLDQYISALAQNQRPDAPIVRPAANLIDPAQHVDARKVERQHQLLDEQIAFVLGHELAHHYLGHTGCANGGGSRGVSPADLNRVLSRTLPMFNQPNEIAADQAGVNNLLTAGMRSSGYRYTEAGAVLTLNFFNALDQLTPAAIVFAFESSHPHPLVRLPLVQVTAQTFRLTGGAQLPTWW